MKKLLTLILISIGLVGCTTSPVSSERAKLVPKDRMLAYTEPNPEYAKVQIIRDVGFFWCWMLFCGYVSPNYFGKI